MSEFLQFKTLDLVESQKKKLEFIKAMNIYEYESLPFGTFDVQEELNIQKLYKHRKEIIDRIDFDNRKRRYAYNIVKENTIRNIIYDFIGISRHQHFVFGQYYAEIMFIKKLATGRLT